MTVNGPHKANILSVHNSTLDSVIFLDTNTLLYAFAYPDFISEDLVIHSRNNTALKRNYLDFFQRLQYEDSIGIYTIFNKEEIRHICQMLVSQRKALTINKKTEEWQSVFSAYPELREESLDISNRIFTSMQSTPYLQYFPIDNEQNLDPIVEEILSETSINTTDAYIFASSLQYGVNSIASEDGGFCQVKGINLYTANQSIIKNTSGNKLTDFEYTKSLYRSLATNEPDSTHTNT